jgi:GT2 family glycosyltransferase
MVTVVVPVRDGERTMEACVTSILRGDYPEALREVVVVDNASTDRTADIVRRYPVKCVHEPVRGRSHARNRGIQASEAPIVAFTDADCVVTGSWLRELVEAFDEDAVSAVAGEILPDPPRTPSQQYMALRKRCWQHAALTSPWPYAVTANVAFRRDVFARIGGFDPRFPTGEDQDISWRFLQAGLTLRYAPAAVVFHRHRTSAWDFFIQQLGWAHGSWRLHSRYDLPGGLGAQGGQRGRLLRLTAMCVRAGCRRWARGAPEMSFYNPLFDLIREVAWRLAGAYSAVVAPPVAFRPRPRVKLDVPQWRVRISGGPPSRPGGASIASDDRGRHPRDASSRAT